jgi:hypothetical protein
MSKVNIAGVALAALVLSGLPLSVYAADAPKGPEVSAVATKGLLAVQQAADAGKYDEVVARSQEVLALPGRTPADAFVANQFMAVAYNKLGNKVGILTALQGQLDSGYPDAAEQARLNNIMLRTAYELKDYAKVAEYGNRLVGSGNANAEAYGLIGDGLFQQGKHAEVVKFLSDHVAEQERTAQVPRERMLNTLFSAQEKLGDKAGVTATLEKLVASYPRADYWNLLLFSMARDPALTDRQLLQIYRLKLATQTMQRCADYVEMADIAAKAGIRGEGQKVLELGLASQPCAAKADQDRLQALLTPATKAASEDQAQLGKLETEAKAAKSGELDVVVGSSLAGYGQYPRAVEVLSRGIAKGGLKNLSEAQIMLGIAQLRAGTKPEATTTFKAVKAEDAFTQRIARLWVLNAR